ncbi:cobalamin B12-binding domain-containing protein, partial [Candidatus Bathyarchaeota archaeon]|nr:cobalamin B12-binding domain-containing protein [Candidatus Bathyarchaeota archaeon]
MKKEKGKKRIALIIPPLLKGSSFHPLFPPLGLTYIAAVLEQEGHEIAVIDCPICKFDHEKLMDELTSFHPDIVGISAMTTMIVSALQAAKNVKETCPEATVVLGGPHATFMDEEILRQEPSVDIIVRGEGEYTMLELARFLPNWSKLADVKGITLRRNGKIFRTPPRPHIQDLDSLPYPAYHYLPMEKYRIYGRVHLPVMSSRGCPFQCTFCVASQIFGAKFRARSPKNVVDEMEWLRDNYGAEAISFHDDTLTLDKQRMLKICEEIKKRKVELPWGCQTRVDRVSKELLSKMREASCHEASFGVESGSQKIIDAVGKGITHEQCEKAVKWAKEENLFVAVSAILGYPGETKETLQQTVDFVRRLEPDDAWLCIATPYPGTVLRALIESMGWKIHNDWNIYDTSHVVFENPELPAEEILNARKRFYNSFYTPKYMLRQAVKGYLKGNFYSRVMA